MIWVGVQCPVEVLEQREAARGDREVGTARSQFDAVHREVVYDVEVDSSVMSPLSCAAVIVQALHEHPG